MRDTDNDALHFRCINELTVDAILKVLDHFAEVEDSYLFVHEELAEGLGDSNMLLQLTLFSLFLNVDHVALAGLLFELFLCLDQCHGGL